MDIVMTRGGMEVTNIERIVFGLLQGRDRLAL
jgi:hypothetical protein